MHKQPFNKIDLDNILTSIDYYNHFEENFLNRSYSNIDYGKRIGIKSFKSLFDAADQYTYSGQVKESDFIDWNRILNDENSSEEILFCTVLEIFVWGGVLNGNVKAAIDLYKKEELKEYLKQIVELLKVKDALNKESIDYEIIWSSGWTKVYSFINNDILIYDSRVSAFLNHTLTYDIVYTEEQIEKLKELANYLFNFQGAENRERLVDRRFGFKNSNPSGINGFNANLISSWIAELLNEKLNLNKKIRDFERAFFMLGFDLKQIKDQHNG